MKVIYRIPCVKNLLKKLSACHPFDVVGDEVKLFGELHFWVDEVEQDGRGHDGSGVKQGIVWLICFS